MFRRQTCRWRLDLVHKVGSSSFPHGCQRLTASQSTQGSDRHVSSKLRLVSSVQIHPTDFRKLFCLDEDILLDKQAQSESIGSGVCPRHLQNREHMMLKEHDWNWYIDNSKTAIRLHTHPRVLMNKQSSQSWRLHFGNTPLLQGTCESP